MKSIVIKIFILIGFFSIRNANKLLAQECSNCPTAVTIAELPPSWRMVMIFDNGVPPMEDITVYDHNGNLCGTYTPYNYQGVDNIWAIEFPVTDCPNIMNPEFTGTLLIGSIECNIVAGATEDCNTECLDCPLSFNYDSPYGPLAFELSQTPSWASTPYLYYIKSPGTTPKGPFNIAQLGLAGPGTSWAVPTFPAGLLPIQGGSFVFGPGLMQCNYQSGAFVDCVPSNPGNCNCPFFDITLYYLDQIRLGFESQIPYAYPEPVTVSLDWGQNSSGPYLANWLSQGSNPESAWRIDMTDPYPPNVNGTYLLYNGELTMNNEITCIYENGISVGCEESFFGDPDCGHLAGCEEELESFVLNLPGSGCAKWATACNSYDPIYRFGNVSIGDAGNTYPGQFKNVTPNGYKLSVTGGIMTDFIKVELCGTGGWCDYVFHDDYQLKPLNEVEKFIHENGYLPNSISEEEVISNGGIEIKGTLLNQQEKIEELYLYLIEMNKKIKSTELEIKLLEAENNFLKITNSY